MEPIVLSRGSWAAPRAPTDPLTVTQLIAAGTLDAELAALLWLLVERRVPLVVAAARPGVGSSTLLDALLEFLPADVEVRAVRGADEDFAWLPQARGLGWSGPLPPARAAAAADPQRTVLYTREPGDGIPAHTWGMEARVVVRAVQLGYGFAATLRADSLEEVFASLGAEPVRLSQDEIRRLGVVLVLRTVGGARRRVVAAHYLRPLERDGHGHLQRRPPAVLATWDRTAERFEHFAWGVMPELAARVGLEPGDLDGRHVARTRFLHRLVHAGVLQPDQVRQELLAYQDRSTPDPARGDP